MINCCKPTHHHHHRRHRHHDCHFPFETPFDLVSSIPFNGQTNVCPNLKAVKLILQRGFNEGVEFDVSTQIDMWRGSLPGKLHKVPVTVTERGCGSDFRRVILVKPVYPLHGGTVYRVRVMQVFFDPHGVRRVKTALIVFTTGCR